ncbi:MAG: hypothetical protein ACOX52_03835 [Verrucomicrobiota bacterium]|jgi:hypothetical protein
MNLTRLSAPILIPSLIALFALSLTLGCSSDSSSDADGDPLAPNSGETSDVSGPYTAQFFTVAGGSTPGSFTIAQDEQAISLKASCVTQDDARIDCESLNDATGTLGASEDGVRFPFSMSNDHVVITGMFIRQSQGILLDAEVSGSSNANTGQIKGAQTLEPAQVQD